MALGPGFFYDDYKNKTIQELKELVKDLQSRSTKLRLKIARKEQVKQGIDDNNVWSDHETRIEVFQTLIQYKTMYPASDLSNWDDYWSVNRAVKDKSGPVKHDESIPVNTSVYDEETIARLKELGIVMPEKPIPPTWHK